MTDLYKEFKQLEEELRNSEYKAPNEIADKIHNILDEDESFHPPSPEEEDGEDALCTVCGEVLDGSDDEATVDEIRGPEHGASKVVRRYICSEDCAMEFAQSLTWPRTKMRHREEKNGNYNQQKDQTKTMYEGQCNNCGFIDFGNDQPTGEFGPECPGCGAFLRAVVELDDPDDMRDTAIEAERLEEAHETLSMLDADFDPADEVQKSVMVLEQL